MEKKDTHGGNVETGEDKMLHATVDDPHPWMVAVTGRSCYSSRRRKSTGRVENPRVG